MYGAVIRVKTTPLTQIVIPRRGKPPSPRRASTTTRTTTTDFRLRGSTPEDTGLGADQSTSMGVVATVGLLSIREGTAEGMEDSSSRASTRARAKPPTGSRGKFRSLSPRDSLNRKDSLSQRLGSRSLSGSNREKQMGK